ncbi:acyltransferase [Ligilactobacillus equi]|nr:acyltransferase [Ligilactobacillus equi]
MGYYCRSAYSQYAGGGAQVYCRPFLNFAVGLFLFMSGMLSNVDQWNVKKRLKKVIIPYVIWTIIYVILYHASQPMVIPKEFLKALFTGSAAAVMYYVFVYCELTILMPVIDKMISSKFKYLGFVISPIEIILMRLIPLVSGHEVNKYLAIVMSLSCLGWFTYYYLGYALGNGFIKIEINHTVLIFMWFVTIFFQILEGYWYLKLGETNCGTQLKLSSILTGTIFVILIYKFIYSDNSVRVNVLKVLGDYSFGIYFAHLAVMTVLSKLSNYSTVAIYPVNGVVAILVTFALSFIGRKILGKYSGYLAL